MNNGRPASRNRRRSILTTSIGNASGIGSPRVGAGADNNERVNRSLEVNAGKKCRNRADNPAKDGRINDPLSSSGPMPPSIFRTPSLEEQLVNLGIELKGVTSGSAVGATGSWKTLRDNASSGGDSGEGGSSRSVNSISSGGGGQGSDLSNRKSARLSSDISKRISGISSSMDQYDRKVRDVQETMQTAYRNTVEDRRKHQSGQRGEGDDSSGSLDVTADDFFQKCGEALKKDLLSEFGSVSSYLVGPGGDSNNNDHDLLPPSVSEHSSPRKIFGLNAAAILETSSSESSSEEDSRSHIKNRDENSDETSSEEEEGAATMKISIKQAAPTGRAAKSAAMKRFEENIKNKKQQQQKKDGRPPHAARSKKKRSNDDLLPPRSLSPIMPSVPDKQFQTMLERREARVSRHLTSMKNELAQLNHKVEMDKRKAADGGNSPTSAARSQAGTRGIMPHSYQGRPMRLMKNPADKSLNNEFSSFVQSTGGQAGGWERKDHNSFLKIFDVWKKRPTKLMETLKRELPHKKPQEIASHIKWFERFEQLSSANRANVHQWTQEKRRESELIYQMGSASQRAKLEGDKRRQEHLRMIREQERDRGKEKLAQWKRSQAVRSVTSATSPPQQQAHLQTAPSTESSSAFVQQQHLHQHNRHLFQQRPRSTDFDSGLEPHHHAPLASKTSVAVAGRSVADGTVDIAGVRQHILDITAKVHALDNPKRDFRPPRPVGDIRRIRNRQEGAGIDEEANDLKSLGVSRSFTNIFARPPTPPPPVPPVPTSTTNRILKLPEIEPEPPRTRPTSSTIIPSSLIHQQQQRNRRLIAEFRERDSRLVEAKKKAVEIARDRRKSNLSQLTPEEIKRRIRSRVTDSTSSTPTFLNPTKQSELRKTLTHLERLEMLSKQDLNAMGAGVHEAGETTPILSPAAIISNVPSKGIPSWRRPHGGGDYF